MTSVASAGASATAPVTGPPGPVTSGAAPSVVGAMAPGRRKNALPDAARSMQHDIETDLQMRSPPSRNPDAVGSIWKYFARDNTVRSTAELARDAEAAAVHETTMSVKAAVSHLRRRAQANALIRRPFSVQLSFSNWCGWASAFEFRTHGKLKYLRRAHAHAAVIAP